jgi:hypothetical protein
MRIGRVLAVLALQFLAGAPALADALTAPFPKIDGWKLQGPPSIYTPENLFEYIDGAAETFLQFDVQELASAIYVVDPAAAKSKARGRGAAKSDAAPAKVEIAVDIYRHRDPWRAFGMYSQERPAGSTRLPIGADAYRGDDNLQLVVGASYVKLAQFGGGDPAAIRTVAEKVAAALPGTRDAPQVLGCFPERGKRPRAEKLTARAFLGHAFLHDAVAVPYDLNGARFRLFALAGKDASDTRDMVKRYLAVGKSQAEVSAAGSATVKDLLNGEVSIQWNGRWLWGAVDQVPAQRAALLDELGRRLLALGP